MEFEKVEKLRDLGDIVAETRKRLSEFAVVDIQLSQSFKEAFSRTLSTSGNSVYFDTTTATITTSAGQRIYAPNQWFVLATLAVDLVEEIIKYRNITEYLLDINKALFGGKEKKDIYKSLKMKDDDSITATFKECLDSFLSEHCDDESVKIENDKLLYRFVSDSDWWLGGKGIERSNDYYVSPILGVLNLVNASQSYVATITYLYIMNPDLQKELNTIVHTGEEKINVQSAGNEYQHAANIINQFIAESGWEAPVSRGDVEENRRLFIEKFSPEKLKNLGDDELLDTIFYTTGDNTESLCCWIEMNKECRMAFGSIAGGSAFKFGLFQKKDTGVWTTGSPNAPQELSDEDALVLGKEIRDALVRGTEVIKNAQLDSLADYEKLDDDLKEAVGSKFYDWGWFHKYYSIIYPDRLSSFHSTDWQKHALRCFLIQPSEKYYARSGQLAMIQNYGGLYYSQFISALREKFSGIIQFVRLGTSDSEKSYVAEWKKKSVVGIGWSAIGSLEEYTAGASLDRNEIAKRLAEEYYPEDARLASRKAGELVRFYDTNSDTVFVPMEGERLYGLVDEIGDYFYDSTSNMSSMKTGKWHLVFDENDRMPEKGEGLRTSCIQIKDDKNLLYLYEKYYYASEYGIEEEKCDMAEEIKLKNCLEIERNPRTIKIHPMNVIIYGAPGTGKTYSTAEYALAIVENRSVDKRKKSPEERKQVMKSYNELIKKGQVVFTTFHQSYGYEEFIQGLRPDTTSEKMSFKTVDGVFKQIADLALNDEDNNYVIIIDEINRANISKVFGELITLIEDDKRWGEVNETCATLQSGDVFAVPNNLYIVGTMNSADKSISLIDAALRRRFSFIEQKPEAYLVEDATLRRVLEKLNTMLADELDSSDLLIGHSYFLNKTVDDLYTILNNNIIPLLYEYFYDNKKKVASVLKEAIEGTDIEIVDDKIGRLSVKKIES